MGITASPRINVAVINDHLKKLTEPGIRDHVLLAGMRANNRITYNHAGEKFDWRVRFRRTEPTPNDDMMPTTFDRPSRYKTAVLGYRSYRKGEFYTKFEKLASQDRKLALINVIDQIAKDMSSDFNEYFHLELYNDGNAAATNDRIHGLESIFGKGSVLGGSTSPCFAPSDTYGDLSTVPGTYGGTWSDTTEYPLGTGDLEYHFWSPQLVDYTSAKLNGTTHDWANQWRETLRFMDTYQRSLHSKGPDLFLMSHELERVAKGTLEDKERINITPSSQVVGLGFKSWNFEGIELVAEYGCPNVVYGIRWDAMELRSMQSQLFATDEDDDIDYSAKKFAMDFYGNMRFESPAFFCKAGDF